MVPLANTLCEVPKSSAQKPAGFPAESTAPFTNANVTAQVAQGSITHQSGIKTTFLLYQTAGGAMTAG